MSVCAPCLIFEKYVQARVRCSLCRVCEVWSPVRGGARLGAPGAWFARRVLSRWAGVGQRCWLLRQSVTWARASKRGLVGLQAWIDDGCAESRSHVPQCLHRQAACRKVRPCTGLRRCGKGGSGLRPTLTPSPRSLRELVDVAARQSPPADTCLQCRLLSIHIHNPLSPGRFSAFSRIHTEPLTPSKRSNRPHPQPHRYLRRTITITNP